MESRFSKQSDLYARYRPTYPDEMYDFILSHVASKEKAWDCATGSGQVAAVLADHFDEVYASDISTEQMAHAPRRPNITYSNVPAEDTGFPPNHFDLITVAQAIHWFDIDDFFMEVSRVAKDDAIVAIIGYGLVRIDSKIDELVSQFSDDMFGHYFYENRKLLDERYQTIPFPFDEIPAPEFEKKIEWRFEDLKGFLNSWSPVQKYKDDHDENPVDPLLDNIRPLWRAGDVLTISFPIFLRMGRI